jgi:hypothetical protein
MKSDKKQQNIKLKPNKKVLKKPKENEFETTSMNYFRILKELEKKNTEQKLAQELKKKENNPKKANLTEVIYEKNSKKLGNYYNKNQNDLLLYGSSKYDILSMDKLLQEMGNYKSKVINKINEKKGNKNSNNVEISDILQEYKGFKKGEILTPLAENEKENEMEMFEKKNFDEAKRIGVVMRRIEYTSLLNKRNRNGDNKEMLTKLRNSAKKIENYWLRHRQEVKRKNNERRGHIEIQYLSKNDNLKRLEELEKSYEELNKLYLEAKEEIERLILENKDLQQVIEENNKSYSSLLTEKNNLQDIYDKLLEEKKSLNEKYDELVVNLNLKEEELNKIKEEMNSKDKYIDEGKRKNIDLSDELQDMKKKYNIKEKDIEIIENRTKEEKKKNAIKDLNTAKYAINDFIGKVRQFVDDLYVYSDMKSS